MSDDLIITANDDELGLPEDDDPAADAEPVVDVLDDNLVISALDGEGDEESESAEGAGVAEVADLLAGALISGSTQAAEAAISAYNAIGREPSFGGPLKVEVPVEDTAPTSELDADQAAKGL